VSAARTGKRAKSRSARPIQPKVAAASPPSDERYSYWGYLLLVGLTVAVYAPVASYDFVRFDDPDYVTQNDQVRAGLTWHGLHWAFTTGHIANWHPLTWLSHMLDVQLFGVSAGAHHVVNLVFHVASSLLLFIVLRRMTGAAGRSMVVAALFAIHPLHVESVAWVSERKDVLSTLFWMLALLAYVAYVRRHEARWYAAALLSFALGLLSKPMVVTLPFVLLLLDIWPLQRIALWRDGRLSLSATERASPLRVASEKLPFFVLAAMSGVVTVLVQARWGAVGGLTQYPAGMRVMNAVVNYIAYLGMLVWPAKLAVFYPYRASVGVPAALGAGLLLVAITAWSVRASRERPYALVGWLWFVGTLLPVIGIVQAGLQSIADRYTYIPAIGLFVVVSWGGAELVERWTQRRYAATALASLVLGAYAIRAAEQVRTWKDSETLWRHAVDVTTDNAYASYNLGVVLVQAGKTDEGIARLQEALRIQPDYADVHIDLGNALRGRGALDAAIEQFAIVVKLRPAYAAARVVYADVLRDRGRPADAIVQYREALRLDPTLAGAHNELGNVLTAEGRHAEAMTEYAAAVRLDPGLAEARNNLGGSLVRAGKPEEALAEFLAALRLAPNDATFHYNTALTLERLGRTSEALEQLRAALQADPQHAPSLRALERLEPAGRGG
jgi:tetratricopeptide (TPR) repeat protein